MRINNNNPVSGVHGRGAKKRSSGTGETFRPDDGGSASSAQATSGATGIHGVDALLALQEVGSPLDKRGEATRQGHELLDELEMIRADLLAGHISEQRLNALSDAVSSEIESGDKEVDAVLREIELRVKVELAKLGRFPASA
ncbi:class II flagellar assembly regulator [Roseibium hamelinense]|uniref:Class II flagellar assembly regulator n=1 Tax=Roseibium hamelinense TaxID=150831 RepID=A0A562TBU9_9HYPH|nr:flagellar assembly protein FliX [Roseibium hamelinense]MTI45256.1 flagellar assembly regulator FliX [Roseibium hamelinense]TWI90380.1 class II flagellar assembly regulator [Roseibium hamelinense]